MVKALNKPISVKLNLKNNPKKALMALFLLIILLISYYPVRKFVLYKTNSVFEDKPLGFFVHEYNDVDQFRITTLQPQDVDVQEFSYEKVRYKKYGNIIKWTLKADEYFKGHTDVIGICRYHFYVYPNDKVESSIEIDHQGGSCDFWENIKQGDTIDVIGEVITSKSNWTEAGKLKRYATDYVIEVRPMIVKHSDKYYVNTSIPTSIRAKLFKII